jgi:hypothetical protein
MLNALKTWFARAEEPEEDERDASGKPKVTLAKALARGWLELWYQPKVSLHTHNMVGAEGLVRVRHPELGVLGPGAFLPGAADADMLAMTERVIATALRDWQDCAEFGAPALDLAVNVPASAFVTLPIAQLIREERPKSEDWPGLILEVTEDQVVNDLTLANESPTSCAGRNAVSPSTISAPAILRSRACVSSRSASSRSIAPTWSTSTATRSRRGWSNR